MNTSPLSSSYVPITPATRVTIARLLGVPVFILLMIYYRMSLAEGDPAPGYRYAALALFILIAATDALDGFLARSRDEETRLGAVLDPLADKLLLLAGIILLTHPRLEALEPQFPVWFALLIVSRDVALVLGSYLIHWLHGHVDVYPRITGKAATLFQMAAIIAALIQAPKTLFLWLVGLAAAFTLVSGLQYLVDGVRQLERPNLA